MFEVQTSFGDTWENCWSVDDAPQYFDTRKEARAAINDHLADVRAAVKAGDMIEGYSRADFRIVEIARIYDNGGKTYDRYTAVYVQQPESDTNLFAARGMSANPLAPQGFGQYCSAMAGRHLGKRIAFADLPQACRKLVLRDLAPE